eukprot:6487498-Amphidinium_carterae.2
MLLPGKGNVAVLRAVLCGDGRTRLTGTQAGVLSVTIRSVMMSAPFKAMTVRKDPRHSPGQGSSSASPDVRIQAFCVPLRLLQLVLHAVRVDLVIT